MGRLRNRIKTRGDTYYVEAEAYRKGRAKVKHNLNAIKMGVGSLVIGCMAWFMGNEMDVKGLETLGIILTLYGVLVIAALIYIKFSE